MPTLPDRPSLEFLKKRAKEQLQVLRQTDPRAQLAAALRAIAEDYGFSSWRALKAEVDRRRDATLTAVFDACSRGDVSALRLLLDADPSLARATKPPAPYAGWTALHEAVKSTHLDIVRMLLEHGADPDAREAGDNTTPLHWAAATGRRDLIEALLDAGADVHGYGDVHELEVIGWGTLYHEPSEDPNRLNASRLDAISLLLERGARHHIFSAICVGDLHLIQRLVEENPAALDRRMSRFEHGQTSLHFAIGRKRYDILDLLIELGADLEAEDAHGRTAMAVAMLHGDREAMTRLHAAGARQERSGSGNELRAGHAGARRHHQEGRADDQGDGCRQEPGLVRRARLQRSGEIRRQRPRQFRHGLVRRRRADAEHARLCRAPRCQPVVLYRQGRRPVRAAQVASARGRPRVADETMPTRATASCSNRTSRTCSMARGNSACAIRTATSSTSFSRRSA